MVGGEGFAVGDEGTVLKTTDGGRTWKAMEVPIQARLFWFGAVSIRADSGLRGFVAGAHGFLFRIEEGNLAW